MPPKKATGTTTTAKKPSAPSDHPSYKDMIKDAILQLKERNGSSRQALKKYVLSNNKGIKESNFDTQFNAAIKRGVAAGDFIQPKGPSGPVKLQKKDAAKPAAKATKATGDKPAKKPTVKKTAVPKKTVAPKAAKPKAAAKPKTAAANSKKPRKTTTTTTTTEKPSGLTKTKAGRVSKVTKAPPKKAASKKAAPKKKAAEAAAPSTE